MHRHNLNVIVETSTKEEMNCCNARIVDVVQKIENDEKEQRIFHEEEEKIQKMYDEILKTIKENETSMDGLKNSASIISGFAGWMALGIPKDVPCPAYAICITTSAVLSLSMVIVFTFLSFMTARLQGYAKADFVYDTRYYRAGGWLMLAYSLPLFLVSFVLKFSCEFDEPYNMILSSVFGAVIMCVFFIIARMLYMFRPQVLCFFATVPLVGLGFYWFPEVFEQLGQLTSVRDWVSHNGDRLWLRLKKDVEIKKRGGNSELPNQKIV